MPNVLGGGDVAGPASATDNAVARFDGTTGKLIQNSTVTIADTTGDIAGAQSLTAPAATNLTLAGGTAGSDSVVVSNTLAASSAIIGAFKVGNGTAATNVAIGGGNINAGGNLTVGGSTITLSGSTPVIDMGAKTSANNPIIDFNSSGNSNDFDVRLAAKGGTSPSGTGTLTVHGTLAATASNVGAFLVGDSGTGTPTAATSVAIGGGKVNIGDTTAGSSGAGALVVAGGLATGAASYIGGNLTIAGGTVNVLTPAPSTNSDNGPLYFYNSTTATGAYAAIKPFTGAYGDQVGIKFVTTLSTQTTALTLAPSGAATFAGAVTATTGAAVGGATAGAGGLAFPATAVAVADANTLDDYEEGTWDAAFATGGGTVTINTASNRCRYTKIGRLVTVNGFLQISSVSSPTGPLLITGLPFTIPAATEGDAYSAVSIMADSLEITATGQIVGYGAVSSTNIYLYRYEAGALIGLAPSVKAGSEITFTFTYSV